MCDIIYIWVWVEVLIIKCVKVGSKLGWRLVFGLFNISKEGGCGVKSVVINNKYCSVLFDNFDWFSGCSNLGW